MIMKIHIFYCSESKVYLQFQRLVLLIEVDLISRHVLEVFLAT